MSTLGCTKCRGSSIDRLTDVGDSMFLCPYCLYDWVVNYCNTYDYLLSSGFMVLAEKYVNDFIKDTN